MPAPKDLLPVTPPARLQQQQPNSAFAAPSTPLSASLAHPAAAELVPSLDAAATFAAILYEQDHIIEGSLLPSAAATEFSDHDALGICAHWHSATQDVDFERKLLLRALLNSLPPQAFVLPHGCASLDEVDLAPLKVQSLLEALGAGAVADLNSSMFRWDLKQPPPKLAWGGDEHDSAGGGSSGSSGSGGSSSLGGQTASPPWAGLSKRQLDAASYEALLLAIGPQVEIEGGGGNGGNGGRGGRDAASDATTVQTVAAQLGIGIRQHRVLYAAVHRRTQPLDGSNAHQACAATAAAATTGAADKDEEAVSSAAAVSAAVAAASVAAAAAGRCGMRQRLALLQTTSPRDFETDNDFFEWQERQAALLGASLHAIVAQLAAEYDDPEQRCVANHCSALALRRNRRLALSPSLIPSANPLAPSVVTPQPRLRHGRAGRRALHGAPRHLAADDPRVGPA